MLSTSTYGPPPSQSLCEVIAHSKEVNDVLASVTVCAGAQVSIAECQWRSSVVARTKAEAPNVAQSSEYSEGWMNCITAQLSESNKRSIASNIKIAVRTTQSNTTAVVVVVVVVLVVVVVVVFVVLVVVVAVVVVVGVSPIEKS